MTDNDPEPPRQGSGHAPAALVFTAVAVGGLGIGFGIAATILMVRGRDAAAQPSASAPALPAPEAPPAPPGPWTSELHAESCVAPCCGGSACRVSSENTGKNHCKDGAEFCDRCVSTVSCIPGTCSDMLEGTEELSLHLSSIVERSPAGESLDACKTGRDLWLCFRRRLDTDWQCLSQREACSNHSRSPAAIAVTGDDVLRESLELEVREGAPDGSPLARHTGVLYRKGVQRKGLCGGLKVDLDASSVTSLTFFLDDRASDAPDAVRVPVKSDAGTVDAAISDGGLEAGSPATSPSSVMQAPIGSTNLPPP